MKTTTLLKILIFISLFVVIVWFTLLARESDYIQELVVQFGYIGIYLFSVASGFNVLVPIPAIAFVPLFVESGLSFATTIIVITLGLTTGDALGFLLGNVGRELARNKVSFAFLEKIERAMHTHYFVPILFLFVYAAFVPFPNEVLVIPLAFLGYKARYILGAIFFGNIIFNTLYGYAGVSFLSFF